MDLAGQLLWAAGLLEADGAFYVTRSSAGRIRGRIQCRMTEPDVLARLVSALDAGRVNGPYGRSSGSMGAKMTWVFQINRQADVARVARALKQHMGRRRQGQIAEMLEAMQGR
ncbi:MAG: hypothetical protein ACYTG1_00730 [Planctomycetota bacterium]|jgi:hypothetical protein